MGNSQVCLGKNVAFGWAQVNRVDQRSLLGEPNQDSGVFEGIVDELEFGVLLGSIESF